MISPQDAATSHLSPLMCIRFIPLLLYDSIFGSLWLFLIIWTNYWTIGSVFCMFPYFDYHADTDYFWSVERILYYEYFRVVLSTSRLYWALPGRIEFYINFLVFCSFYVSALFTSPYYINRSLSRRNHAPDDALLLTKRWVKSGMCDADRGWWCGGLFSGLKRCTFLHACFTYIKCEWIYFYLQ